MGGKNPSKPVLGRLSELADKSRVGLGRIIFPCDIIAVLLMNEKAKDCPFNVIILISKMKILPARIRGLVTDVSCVESTASHRQVNVSVHSFSFQFFYCSSFFSLSGF